MSARLISLFIAVVVVLSTAMLFGCQKQTGQANDKAVLAVVNGDNITVEDFKAFLQYNMPKSIEEKKGALAKMIQNRLLASVAVHRGLNTDPMVRGRLLEFNANYLPEVLKEDIAKKVTVSDSEIPGNMVSNEPVVSLLQIVTPTLEDAEAALQELKKGANFEEVAKKRSIGISAGAGGNLGAVRLATDDLYTPGVKAVINKLNPGEMTPIVKTDLGYSIFKMKSRKDAGEMKKESLDAARKVVKDQKVEYEMAKLKQELASKAKIELNEKLLKGDKTQTWAAKIDDTVISVPQGLFEQSENPDAVHVPHQSMNERSILSSLKDVVVKILLVEEAKRRGLDKDPGYKKMERTAEEAILTQVMLENLGTFEPTEQEMKDYYAKYKERFAKQAGVHVGRILTPTEKDAKSALAELKKGAEFSKVAMKYSIDKSKLQGGDMGWYGPDRLASPFKETVAALKPGQVSGIIHTPAGYDIMKLTERVNEGIPDFSELRDTIGKRVTLQKRSEAVEALYKEVAGRSKVTINEALLKSL